MGKTSLSFEGRRRGFSTQPDEFHVAAASTWITADILEIQARYYETPFFYTLTCKFDEDQVNLQTQVNVAFGPAQIPTLVGSLN